MEVISFRWFSIFYLALGTLLMTGGIYMIARRAAVTMYVIGASSLEKPPAAWIYIARYLLLFTIPCLFLSFFPLSWPELLFSVWLLVIIYTAGQLLVHWPQISKMIRRNQSQIPAKIIFIAANMLSLGLIMFLLYYHLHSRGI